MSILPSAYTDFAKNVSSLLWEVGMYKFTGSHFFFIPNLWQIQTRIMVFLHIFILIFSFNFFPHM